MNIKASYSYQMNDAKKSLIIFYSILVGISVLGFILLAAFFRDGSTVFLSGTASGGNNQASLLFLFILGLCSHKENFTMLIQNGLSRKSVIAGRILTNLSLAAIVAFADMIMLLLEGWAMSAYGGRAVPLLGQVFEGSVNGMNPFLLWGLSLIMEFLLAFMAANAGYFLTSLFYRLPKSGRVAVGAGAPILLLIVFPIADAALFKGRITLALARFVDFALGISSGKPLHAFVTFLLLSALLSLICWLTVRRAPVKE